MKFEHSDLPVPVVCVDRVGAICAANDSALFLFGYSDLGQLVGRPVDVLLPPGQREHHPSYVQGYLTNPVSRPMAEDRCLQGQRADGSLLHVRVALVPTELGAAAFIFDLTKIVEAMAALERTNQDLEQFAYVASHDLQEPLRAVAGYVQLIATKYQSALDVTGRGFIDRTLLAVARLRQMVIDLLAFSRAGVLDGDITNPRAVLVDVMASLAATMEEQNAQVKVEGDWPAKIHFSSVAFASVVQNLVANAIKFKRPDMTPEVLVSCVGSERGYVTIEVADCGLGVQDEYVGKLFKVFSRLHHGYPGTGIGLAVVKRAVEAHGGRVWYEPNTPHGSRFCFTVRPVDV